MHKLHSQKTKKKPSYIWAQMAAPHNSDHHTANWHQNKYLLPEKDG